MAKLLCETSFDTLVESVDKDLYITGVFASAEAKNRNGRIYGKSILEREIQKLNESEVNNKSLRGELEHPRDRPNTLLERAAIMITELDWMGNDVKGKAVVLDTPHGQILKSILAKGNVGISSRGLGTVGSNGYVNENYKCISFDVVGNASNFGSTTMDTIYESMDFPLPDELEEQKAKDLSEAKRIEEEKLNEAKIAYKKHLWTVIDKITKKL